jgi:hypothetical protein
VIALAADVAAALLSGNQKRYVRMQSWLDDTLLSDTIPVSSCTEETDRGLAVPDRISFAVPRRAGGVDWAPYADDHPLAANGQRVRVEIGVGYGTEPDGSPRVAWVPRGWFVIVTSTVNEDRVDVEAGGLLYLIQEARLVSPYQPKAGATLTSVLRDLMGPGVPLVIDPALTNRTVPTTINYDEDRLQGVYDTLTAWPADGNVTEEGYFSVYPAGDPTVPVLALTDQAGGTVVSARGSSTRDGAYNAVVARGTAPDGGQVQGVTYDLSGPKRFGGPFNDLPVPFYFDSPLLTTQLQAAAASKTRLATLKRKTARYYTIDMVPHPGLQVGDLITLTTDTFTARPLVVESLSLPYFADGGAETLGVRTT